MNIEQTIQHHKSFQDSGSVLLCQLIGGSKLYGLDTPESDIDYRGIFLATNKTYVTGFNTIESIVQQGEIDATYYELVKYLKLLRKSNTQVMEMLFAPTSSFTLMSDVFQDLRMHKYELINSDTLKASLKGYVFSEIRLATGERTGQLGGKRKQSLLKYGFSPKNFVQILRLCKVGIEFFNSGEYMVNVAEFDQKYHTMLMDIKLHPELYTCEYLKLLVDNEYKKLEQSIDNSKLNYKFNTDLAADICLAAQKAFSL